MLSQLLKICFFIFSFIVWGVLFIICSLPSSCTKHLQSLFLPFIKKRNQSLIELKNLGSYVSTWCLTSFSLQSIACSVPKSILGLCSFIHSYMLISHAEKRYFTCHSGAYYQGCNLLIAELAFTCSFPNKVQGLSIGKVQPRSQFI